MSRLYLTFLTVWGRNLSSDLTFFFSPHNLVQKVGWVCGVFFNFSVSFVFFRTLLPTSITEFQKSQCTGKPKACKCPKAIKCTYMKPVFKVAQPRVFFPASLLLNFCFPLCILKPCCIYFPASFTFIQFCLSLFASRSWNLFIFYCLPASSLLSHS